MADQSRVSTGSQASLELLQSIHGPEDLKKLPIAQLPQLAQQIRHAICDQVSRTGGHLAPNLGVVELTIALHYVFDFDYDRLLFDVGHQCYTHKLLTGRQHLLPKLKQRGGMAGFPEPRESSYDLFSVGHAGTAISTGVGMARADALLGQPDRHVVSLIGDASIVNGLAMEGLNDVGMLKRQFLVLLNDNGMAIAKARGALAGYFDLIRVSPTYEDLKKRAQRVLKRLPGGSVVKEAYHRLGEMAKAALAHDHMFEHFGLLCVGPIDGHDLPTLIQMLKEIKDHNRPVLLHCKTIKGKGYEFSENDAFKFHSTKAFNMKDCRVQLKSSGTSFTAAFASAMIDQMEKDEKIFAVTAAMPDGTGLDKIMPKFPDRTIDTGICESHAMDMCAGMAKAGLKPFFAIYSTFSQRALDQVFQEVALQGLPVRICMDRSGYVGGDGSIMHGFMDITMYRAFPNAVLLAPSDQPTLIAAIEFMRQYDRGPSFIRYPRGNVAETPLADPAPLFELGKAVLVRPALSNKPDLAILVYGALLYEAVDAIKTLKSQGYDIALYDARFAKPIDIKLIEQLIVDEIQLLTVEDHCLAGGFGAAVLETCNDHSLSTDLIHRLAMPDRWLYQDSRNGQLADAGLDAAGIARRVRVILDEHAVGTPTVPTIHVEVDQDKISR